jgi:phosphoglycolate phosphatase
MNSMKHLACLFPGIGYTCDKPLLYYSRKLLKELGWEVLPVSYTGFPDKVRDDPEKKRLCVKIAMEQAEEALRDIDWKQYDDILFIGKSVGTVVSACTRKSTASAAARSCLPRWRPLLNMPAPNLSCSTGPRIPGRKRT